MLTKLYKWGAALVGGLVLLLSVFQAGRREAKTQAKAERDVERAEGKAKAAEKKAQVIETKQEIKNEVDSLPDGGAADRLRDKWSRD